MATKSMRLLQIFLYNKDNGISRGRLLESRMVTELAATEDHILCGLILDSCLETA